VLGRAGNADLQSWRFKLCEEHKKDKCNHAYLIPSAVPNKDDKRPVVLLDIIVDEDGDPIVKLLPHFLACNSGNTNSFKY